jgi:membrane-associated phospholipid phosphatase
MQQVYDVSRSLTPEQTAIALYWADGAGTVTPPGHWDAIALDLAAGENLSTVQLARLFVTLNTAQADAFIACWDAKFTYWTERPVTAIQAEIDPFWKPLIPTPPFPSYVSGHSTTSGAAATVLAHFSPSAAISSPQWRRRPRCRGSTAASTSRRTTPPGSSSVARSDARRCAETPARCSPRPSCDDYGPVRRI